MNDKEHLQLIVYDDTNIRTRLSDLRALDKLTGVDLNLDINIGLTHSWTAGGRLYRKLRRVDHSQGFRAWHKLLGWLIDYEPEQKISEIQYWGHGGPGAVWLDGEALTAADNSAYEPILKQIAGRLTDDALIWFRTCSTFAGDEGKEFARVWAQKMDCRIAAHVHNIGLFHSGLYTLGPGETAAWPSGLKGGKTTRSGHKKKNTITCLHGRFPSGW